MIDRLNDDPATNPIGCLLASGVLCVAVGAFWLYGGYGLLYGGAALIIVAVLTALQRSVR